MCRYAFMYVCIWFGVPKILSPDELEILIIKDQLDRIR